MVSINITIQGVSPLMCNRFTDEAARAATSGVSSNNQGEPLTEHEQCEKKLYMHKKKPCIPQPNLTSSIMEGGRFHKIKMEAAENINGNVDAGVEVYKQVYTCQ